ncbi:MAG TPA: polyprenol monophosphomannose synthase [Sandaracinaceae bacterium LLY-WYZ-13_1]|nr:polyprenol monophosphomannose synthase [Sandaracinaceae bacterium LLY-WYZ-13_1]
MTRVLVVTPTYNERDNLETFVEAVFAALPEAHVLVVDDASPDGTGAIADRLAGRDERVRVLHRGGKLGIGSAYLEGFARGLADGYDVLVQMDTDLSHDPAYLPAFLARLERGADVVLGSRNVPGGGVEGWGPGRHVLSKGGSLYSRAILGLSIRDLTSGFKAWKAEVLETLDLSAVESEGYSFQIEMTWRALRAGFRVEEEPIVFVDRRAGESKMSRTIFLEAVMMVWKLRLDAMRGL